MQTFSSKKTILIIDDDEVFAKTTKAFLADSGAEVITATSGREGLAVCGRTKVDVVLLDQKLPDGEGANFCPQIIAAGDRTKIIFITAFPSFENALKAIENGAFTYLSKPIEPGEIKIAVERSLRVGDLEKAEESRRYQESKENEGTVLVGRSAAAQQITGLIELAAESEASVLITGETGTGKSLAARAIHLRSQRRGSFLAINCAALPENLVEAELFGFEKGSFSGAVAGKKGLFEIADEGTILLDEIGEMSMHLQAKLLGVLDDRKIRRIGSTRDHAVNSRVIASTNSLIENKLKAREFREDLYYRLNVIRIHIPPLRERIPDIPELARHFLSVLAPGRGAQLPESEMKALASYSWPGNVRELRNVIERALLLHADGALQPSLLLEGIRVQGQEAPPAADDLLLSLEEVERRHIQRALAQMGMNYTRTAKSLGISLSTLKRKTRAYRLPEAGKTGD